MCSFCLFRYDILSPYENNQPIYNTPRGGGYTTKQAAFTLIELLVVIAIIGILAGVVLASLNSARNKGRVASIKSNLRNAVSQSNIYFNENGTYTGLCTDPTIVSILASLGSAACFAPELSSPNNVNLIRDLDWGIATTFDGVHFTADPSGVLQLDATNTGGTQTWDTAMTSCANIGKRMPGGSSLKALYDITASTPSGLTAGSYRSSTPHPTNAASAYYVDMVSGIIWADTKTLLRYVRCGS